MIDETLFENLNKSLNDLKKAKEKALSLLQIGEHASNRQPIEKEHNYLNLTNNKSELTTKKEVKIYNPKNVDISNSCINIKKYHKEPVDSEKKIEDKDFFPRIYSQKLFNSLTNASDNLRNSFFPCSSISKELSYEDSEEVNMLLDYVCFINKKISVNKVTVQDPLEKFILNENKIKISFNLKTNENQVDLSLNSTKSDMDVITENMAKIYYKQGNKEKAIEIYKKLCLKVPNKMSYFVSKISEIQNS